MGIFDSLFGGGDDETKTEQRYDPQTTANQQFQQQAARLGMTPYLSNPYAYVAPLSDHQKRFGSEADLLAYYAKGNNYANTLPDYASDFLALGRMPGGNPDALAGYVGSSQAGALDPFVGSSRAGALDKFIPGYSQQAIDASTIGMDDIEAFANPYAQKLADSGMRRLNDQVDVAGRNIGAQAAAGGAFGGSGEYIQRAMLNEDALAQASDIGIQAQSDAYNVGAQLAGQNAASRTAALQVAGNDVYGRALGAAGYDQSQVNDLFNRASGSAGFNQSQMNDLFNRAQGSSVYGDNVRNDAFNRQQAALQGAATYGLSAAGANNGFANDYVSRNAQSLGLLGGYGDLARQQQQQSGDAPYTSFQRWASLVPGVQPTQVTTAPTNNTGLLGTAVTAAGLFS